MTVDDSISAHAKANGNRLYYTIDYTFPGFLGWLGFFIPLGFGLGGTFVLWTWGRELRSFLALGWCLDGGDLGCGRGAVATWRSGEQSEK